MTSAAPSYPFSAYGSLRLPMAAFELLAYLIVVAIATLCFLAGWLPVNGAVVLTVILLSTLIVMSWVNLGQGRHPCFLFLCTLMFFQGGRLLAYTAGLEPDPMRVRLMGVERFTIGNAGEGIVLLGLALSAVCVYAPCRWNYVRGSIPDLAPVRRYLPYLYLTFLLTLPAHIAKNFLYFQYVQNHGGYLSIYQNFSGLAASVPLPVRAVALLAQPVFVAIFVFETKKGRIALVTVLYFSSAVLLLFTGSRLLFFASIVTLWYVTRIKSSKRSRILVLLAVVLALALTAQIIANYREDSQGSEVFAVDIGDFIVDEGASIDVTQIAVKYREHFDRYSGSYLVHELTDAYAANDVWNYAPGKSLDYDASVLLNPALFALGSGIGSSYVGEAYIVWGMAGVLVVSLLIGGGLHLMYRLSHRALPLLIVALTMPVVLYMPRGNVLGWFSALTRNVVSVVILGFGWRLLTLIMPVRQMPALGEPRRNSESVGFDG